MVHRLALRRERPARWQVPLISRPESASCTVNVTVACSSRWNVTVAPRPRLRRSLGPDRVARNALGVILSLVSLGAGRLTRSVALTACSLPAALLAVT
jgi:hypothetical protein